MACKVISKEVLSTDGKHILKGIVYVPDGEIKAIFHIVHGMTEYIGRYDAFMNAMAENGYLCCGYNHVGHKDTSSDEDLGFFAEENGDQVLIDDVYKFATEIRSTYPDKKYILMGHSMGSFVVRLSAAKYHDYIDGLIVMGTGGPNPAAKVGLALANAKIKLGGGHKVSKFMYSLAFGSYNNKTDKETPSDWLTHDKLIIEKYLSDKYCTFKFTTSAMRDLIKMNYECNLSTCFEQYPDKLPIFLVSGDEDPVGTYGKGVEQVNDALNKLHKNVEMKLYPGKRHEILNEIGREKVIHDIIEWSNRI